MSRQRERRVVITGLGCISPVGNSVAEMWKSVTAGKSGAGHITKFDASAFSTRVGAEVKDFNLEDYINAKDARTMDTFIHYAWQQVFRQLKIAG